MSLLQNKKLIENEDLSGVFAVIEKLKLLSGNAQIDYLKENKDTKYLKEILLYTYSPDFQYKIKEDKYNKAAAGLPECQKTAAQNWPQYKQRLDKFARQKGVKESDIKELIENVYMCLIFKEILFKDLRLGMDIKSFNKVWDDFYVRPSLMLAEEFKGEVFEDAMFSRKLDGRRAYYLNGKFYSRNHKEYKIANIQHILNDIKKINPHDKDVLDGEFVYIDENGKEDFSKSGIVTRDNYTPESKNIKFAVFYILDKSDFIGETKSVDNFKQIYEFSQDLLEVDYTPVNGLMITNYPNLRLVAQYDKFHYGWLQDVCKKNKWEGLMMLDASETYQYKRTKYLQKIKEMKDAEFEIVGCSLGKGRFSNTLGYITVDIGDENFVDIGSGFSDSQRDVIYKNIDKFIGMHATIQYFEETRDSKTGKRSLRFPVFKSIRNFDGEEINL